MRKVLKKWLAPVSLAAGLALGSAVADAANLRFALGYPPGSLPVLSAEVWAETFATEAGDGSSARVYPLSLLNLMETSPGLRDGMADVGVVLMSYYLSEFPAAHMVTELTMLLEKEELKGPHGAIFSGAVMEYIMLNCPQCLDEFKNQNQVFLGSGATPPLPLMCNKSATRLDQMPGLRLRGGGSQHARWAQHIGATSVQMSVNEVYDALDQGVTDCTIQTATELTVFRLMEVVSHITVGAPGGGYAGSAVSNMNRDRWLSLNENQRSAALKAGAAMAADTIWQYHLSSQENLAEAARLGIEVVEADQSLVDETLRFIDQDVETIAAHYASRYGLENTEEKIASFREILTRWLDLIEGVENREALQELYWDEVFSKLDVSSYGV